MAHNPLPDPAAVHPGERELLAAVLANLTDDLPKLVYADWLEERGDERGAFLRRFVHAARKGDALPDGGGFHKTWLDLTGFTAVSEARGCGITPDELLKDALPALTFKSEPAADADLPIGQSKFGGEPDVPPGFAWPEYERGGPLAFLAQFNLSHLSNSPACRSLPSSGLLSVCYSVNGDVFGSVDAGGWRVFHFHDLDVIERCASPGVMGQDERFRPCRLVLTETLMLPEHREFDSDEHRTAYRNEVSNTKLGHQLLGHPRWLQSEGWSSEAGLGPPAVRHLLTLDGDSNPGWSWGDAGLLYFGIAADDLNAERFDRTQFEMQCC